MLANEITQKFIDKVNADKVKLKPLAKKLSIPYDRMYKWYKKKGNPKSPDDKILESWINGTLSINEEHDDDDNQETEEDIKAATTEEMSALFIELMKKLESIEASLQNTALISKDNNSLIRSTLLQLARQEAKGHEEIDANKIFEGSLNAAKEILKQTYDNGSNIYAPLKS